MLSVGHHTCSLCVLLLWQHRVIQRFASLTQMSFIINIGNPQIRICFTKSQYKMISCFSALPGWPYLSFFFLFLLWPALTLQLLVGSIKHLSSVCHVYCSCYNIVTNITGETAPLGYIQYPHPNKQCYVIREKQGWMEPDMIERVGIQTDKEHDQNLR